MLHQIIIGLILLFLIVIGIVSFISYIINMIVSPDTNMWFNNLVLSVISFGFSAIIIKLHDLK